MSGTAFPITDEQLDVRNLGEWMLHSILADYVKRGMGVTADGGANEITVDAGAAAVSFDDQLFHVPLDTGVTQPYATTTGTNFVYVTLDTANGAVSVEVVDTQGAATSPALLVAEVDGGTDAVTLRNRNPDLTFDEVTINEAITVPSATIDGVSSPYATDPHDIGGSQHGSDTLANLNSKVSDATLDDEGDARTPETHSTSHSADSPDEVSVEDLGTAGASGTAPVSQGDGTLAMESVGGSDLTWTEDGNSPQSFTGSDSYTYTLADASVDEILVRAKIRTQPSTDQGLNLTVNGDSGANYSIADYGGTTGSASEVELVKIGTRSIDADGFVFTCDGTFVNNWTMNNESRSPTSSVAHAASNSNITSPLTSFTLSGSSAATFAIDIEVYGRTLG